MAKLLAQEWLHTVNGVKSRGRTERSTSLLWEWSDANRPWDVSTAASQAEREARFFAGRPGGWAAMPPIVDLSQNTGNLATDTTATLNANIALIKRMHVRLPDSGSPAIFHLTSFPAAAADEMYAFGYWAKVFASVGSVGNGSAFCGWIGRGAHKTVIQQDAGSMSATQLTNLAAMTKASGSVNQISCVRIDGDVEYPAGNFGIEFRAADQQTIASFAADNGIAGGQPAPHGGLVYYRRGTSSSVYAYTSYCRFVGFGRACTSLPPFEHGHVNVQYGYVAYDNCEFDGRLSASLNAAQPRRCGVVMDNNMYYARYTNCWFHHSNVSRYAYNAQNANTTGTILFEYCKFEHITDTQNVDPALNGGASLGGYTNATPLGFESSNDDITIKFCIISQDNIVGNSGQVPCHIQLTTVGARNPQGGRIKLYGNVYRHSQAYLDGFLTMRIATATYWYSDGLAVTVDARDTIGGTQKSNWTYTGTRFATSGEAGALVKANNYIANLI